MKMTSNDHTQTQQQQQQQQQQYGDKGVELTATRTNLKINDPLPAYSTFNIHISIIYKHL